jgi:hypothetical protein
MLVHEFKENYVFVLSLVIYAKYPKKVYSEIRKSQALGNSTTKRTAIHIELDCKMRHFTPAK